MLPNETIQPGSIAVFSAAQITLATAELNEAKAYLKERREKAEKLGVNLKALDYVMKIRSTDKRQTAIEFMRDSLVYFAAFGEGIEKSQLDIWNLLEARLPIDETARNEGRVAGLMDKGTETSPHDVSTVAGQQWLEGWHDGQQQRALIMALKPADGGDELIKGSEPDEDPFADADGDDDAKGDE